MPLALEPRTGDFIPYLKYNAKSGRIFTRNDIGEEVEVPIPLVAIFDLEQIKTGWIDFAEGEAPKTAWDSNGTIAPKPSDAPKAKRGFAVNVFAPNFGGLREFSATSNSAVIAVRDLYNNQYEHAPERLQGKVPVVKCERVLPVKSKFGTNYEPVLKIVKWVDRPIGLPLDEKATTSPKPASPKPETLLKPAPSRRQAEELETVSADSDLDDSIPF